MSYEIRFIDQTTGEVGPVDSVSSFDEMFDANCDDVEFIIQLEAMKPGESIRCGGGAAPLIEITAVQR